MYQALGEGGKARADWAKAIAASEGKLAPRAGVLAAYGRSLLASGKYAEAEPVVRECLSVREKEQPDAWTTSNARAMLGGALLGQRKYAEAGRCCSPGTRG